MSAFQIFPRLEPAELEERFRLEMLVRDKIQVIVAIVLVLVAASAFIVLELWLLPSSSALYISVISRCVTVIVSIATIWIVRRLFSIRLFDRIVFVWMTIVVCHLLIINALRPADYVAAVVWDIVTICGVYILAPVPLCFQIPSALLLAVGGSVLWLIHRLNLSATYETVAVLTAYLFANACGIFVSWRLNRSYRQQFVLLMQETKAREELETALAEVKTLRGIIPICSYCGKIRNDKGYYEAVEKYIMEHSEAVFSHTYCPECFAKYYPDLQDTDG
jgi:hypothetical protein